MLGTTSNSLETHYTRVSNAVEVVKVPFRLNRAVPPLSTYESPVHQAYWHSQHVAYRTHLMGTVAAVVPPL